LASRWSAELDYTYSRLWGNYSGLASSDEVLRGSNNAGRVAPNISAYYDTIYQSYDDKQQQVFGRLATDRPHVVKLWATYDTPWGTSIGAAALVESGLLQTSVFLWQQGYPVYYNGRGDLGRTPVLRQVDLQIRHDFHVSGRRRISVEADVINLFDFKTVTGYYGTVYGPSPWRDNVNASDTVFFGGPWSPQQVVATLRAQGAQVRDEVWYKAPNVYQPRREMRLSAKFSF
jgi:hypothetical protein